MRASILNASRQLIGLAVGPIWERARGRAARTRIVTAGCGRALGDDRALIGDLYYVIASELPREKPRPRPIAGGGK